jgi:hypothetical protein
MGGLSGRGNARKPRPTTILTLRNAVTHSRRRLVREILGAGVSDSGMPIRRLARRYANAVSRYRRALLRAATRG